MFRGIMSAAGGFEPLTHAHDCLLSKLLRTSKFASGILSHDKNQNYYNIVICCSKWRRLTNNLTRNYNAFEV